jgi:hypothetical protein
VADLRKLNVRVAQAASFITTADHVPGAARLDSPDLAAAMVRPPQLELFAAAASAVTGEI